MEEVDEGETYHYPCTSYRQHSSYVPNISLLSQFLPATSNMSAVEENVKVMPAATDKTPSALWGGLRDIGSSEPLTPATKTLVKEFVTAKMKAKGREKIDVSNLFETPSGESKLSPEDERKRAHKRVRNRESAQRSRNRRKEEQQHELGRKESLRNENEHLKRQTCALKIRVKNLETVYQAVQTQEKAVDEPSVQVNPEPGQNFESLESTDGTCGARDIMSLEDVEEALKKVSDDTSSLSVVTEKEKDKIEKIKQSLINSNGRLDPHLEAQGKTEASISNLNYTQRQQTENNSAVASTETSNSFAQYPKEENLSIASGIAENLSYTEHSNTKSKSTAHFAAPNVSTGPVNQFFDSESKCVPSGVRHKSDNKKTVIAQPECSLSTGVQESHICYFGESYSETLNPGSRSSSQFSPPQSDSLRNLQVPMRKSQMESPWSIDNDAGAEMENDECLELAKTFCSEKFGAYTSCPPEKKPRLDY